MESQSCSRYFNSQLNLILIELYSNNYYTPIAIIYQEILYFIIFDGYFNSHAFKY